jgi:hypothetical protein
MNALSHFGHHHNSILTNSLHDRAEAGLFAATAVARFSAGENGLGLDDGGDGGCDAARHAGRSLQGVGWPKFVKVSDNAGNVS